MDAATEGAVIAAARRGDRDAFGVLVERYRDRLHRSALGLTRGSADAEDLAQETFVRAYLALDRYRGEGAFTTWLFGILLNVYRRWLRGQRKREGPMSNAEADVPDGRSSPRQDAAAKDELARALAVIDHMPPKLSEVLVLRHVEAMSYDEIARAVGCRVGTVRSRLHRARELLAARWSRAQGK